MIAFTTSLLMAAAFRRHPSPLQRGLAGNEAAWGLDTDKLTPLLRLKYRNAI